MFASHTQDTFSANDLSLTDGLPVKHTIFTNGYVIKTKCYYKYSPEEKEDFFKYIIYETNVIKGVNKIEHYTKHYNSKLQANYYHDELVKTFEKGE